MRRACLLLLLLTGRARAFANQFDRRNVRIGRAEPADRPRATSSLSVLQDVREASEAAANGDGDGATTAHADTRTQLLASEAEFVKSLPDTRAYRAVELPNRLRVLLASDPAADVEAAAVHVRAGHFDDPPHCAGEMSEPSVAVQHVRTTGIQPRSLPSLRRRPRAFP